MRVPVGKTNPDHLHSGESRAYRDAISENNRAIQAFHTVRDAYRRREVDDAKFLDARRKYDQAMKKFDAAFQAEQTRGNPGGRPRAEIQAEIKDHEQRITDLRVLAASWKKEIPGYKAERESAAIKKESGIIRELKKQLRQTRNPRRRNPESDADAGFESFHGEPSKEQVIIESEVHEHENLFVCGRLMELCIETQSGKYLSMKWDEVEDADVPYLASSEDGKQLFIEGGDQEIDLAAIGMDTDRWVKDRMVIGTFAEPEAGRKYNITYRTRKEFDDFEEIDYQHDLGESSKELKNPARPYLEYEPHNKRLYITGGQYLIKLPMVGVSPGLRINAGRTQRGTPVFRRSEPRGRLGRGVHLPNHLDPGNIRRGGPKLPVWQPLPGR